MNRKTIVNVIVPIVAIGLWLFGAYALISLAVAGTLAAFAVAPWLALLVGLASCGVLVWLAIWTLLGGFAIVAALLAWNNGVFK